MDFLVGVWVIYLVGSFLFSMFSPKKKDNISKSPRDGYVEDMESVEKPIDIAKNRTTINTTPKREADIQTRNKHVQELRQRHRNSGKQSNLAKDMSLNQLNNSLKKAKKTLTSNNTSKIKNYVEEDNQIVDYTTIADYDDSQSHYDLEEKNVENYLDELDDWYADSKITDVSWMELDETNILEDEHSQKASRSINRTVNHIYRSLNDEAKLREMMIFNEVINKPKSLRNK